MLQQSCDPLAIVDVGLPSRHRLDVLRVDEQELEEPLQDLIDRSPVDARSVEPFRRAPDRFDPPRVPWIMSSFSASTIYAAYSPRTSGTTTRPARISRSTRMPPTA